MVNNLGHHINTSQPELLLMTLSHLPIKDLSRAVCVSKQWQRATLDSADLRRILFVEPAPTEEYLEWVEGTDPRCYKDLSKWQPVIVNEPSPRSKTIVEPHPVLARNCDHGHRIRIHIDFPVDGTVATVPPAAFLFQPPCEVIYVGFRYGCESWRRFRREGGITFGALREEFKRIDETYEEAVAIDPRKREGDLFPHCPGPFSIRVEGAVATGSEAVRIAREAANVAIELNKDDEDPNKDREEESDDKSDGKCD